MNFLEERIMKDGVVKPGNVLKVDSFLNHQMDIALMEEIGREFKRRFAGKNITKVLTIEASGIGIAAFAAKEFGVPMVFAKKSKSINIEGEMYVAEVEFDGIRYGAVVNIGHSPSVVSLGKRRVEAHILDFKGDIYGRRVELRLLKFLRPEKKFSSREELVAQITADRDMAQQLYTTQPVRKL